VTSVALASYLVESATTGDLTPRERTDFWSEHVSSNHCLLDFRYTDPAEFNGKTIRQRTETYQLLKWWSEEVRYVRTPGNVRRDPDEDYRFVVPLTGGILLRQEGREARLEPNTGTMLMMSAPGELIQDAATQAFILTIPAREVDIPLSRMSPVAAALDMTSGLGRVVSYMVTGLYEERDVLTRSQFDGICDRIVELLCMLVTGDDRPDAAGHLGEVEAVVRRYVREHAADADLTGASMAHALGWSLRQIQVALQRVGTTPRELIREERLRTVRERLQNPAFQHLTITDLAYDAGFSSVSALSSAFRQRFGLSPREMRHEAAQ
jgi:AraC-like DNA-binding protein